MKKSKQPFCPNCKSTHVTFGVSMTSMRHMMRSSIPMYTCKSCDYSQINSFPEGSAKAIAKFNIKKKVYDAAHNKMFIGKDWFRLYCYISLALFMAVLVYFVSAMINS